MAHHRIEPLMRWMLQYRLRRKQIHIHIFVYKTLTERNEEAWQNRNYDNEILQII